MRTIPFQVAVGFRPLRAMQPRARRAVGCRDQYPREQALSCEQAILQPDIGDDRLRHEMRRKPPPRQHAGTVAGAYAPDRFAIPEARQPGGGFQLIVFRHTVAADELAGFGFVNIPRLGRPVANSLQRPSSSAPGKSASA